MILIQALILTLIVNLLFFFTPKEMSHLTVVNYFRHYKVIISVKHFKLN